MIRRLGEGELPWSFDLCVVGAGAIGLALAMQFIDSPWRVVVLESGLGEPDPVADDLNVLTSVGVPHDGAQGGRVRAFGGSTRVWGGQLVPLRAGELAERAWVAHSGWPIGSQVLQPHYRQVEKLLAIEGPPYDDGNWSRVGVSPPQLDPADFCVRFSQWAALGRRNFALMWRKRIERAGNLTVLLDATAAVINCRPADGRCESVEVRSRSGARSVIRADRFVLACGGLETPRLLLASNLPDGSGTVANSSGTVGRFFQDHISYLAGEIEPASREAVQYLFDPRYVGATMFSAKIEPTEAAMQRNRWLNAMAHIAFHIPDALGWMELRRILRSIQAGRPQMPSFDEGLALMKGGVELARLVATRIVRKRRRSPDRGAVLLLIDSEQAPDPESRITLEDRLDVMGMRRARLDWRVGELELRTLTGFARRVASELERVGLGKVRLAGPPDFTRRDEPGAARDIFHHMGTTRMSASAATGVTRTDLRCHDVDNLYIAGCSVFPAGGIANPTFTALALALRLADHLKSAHVVSNRAA